MKNYFHISFVLMLLLSHECEATSNAQTLPKSHSTNKFSESSLSFNEAQIDKLSPNRLSKFNSLSDKESFSEVLRDMENLFFGKVVNSSESVSQVGERTSGLLTNTLNEDKDGEYDQNLLQLTNTHCNWTDLCAEAVPNGGINYRTKQNYRIINEFNQDVLYCNCPAGLLAPSQSGFVTYDPGARCVLNNPDDQCERCKRTIMETSPCRSTCTSANTYSIPGEASCFLCNPTSIDNRSPVHQACIGSNGTFGCREDQVGGGTVRMPFCSCSAGYTLYSTDQYSCVNLCNGRINENAGLCECGPDTEPQTYGGGDDSSIALGSLSEAVNCKVCNSDEYLPKRFSIPNVQKCFRCTDCSPERNAMGYEISCEYVRDNATEAEHDSMIGGTCKCNPGFTYNHVDQRCETKDCVNGRRFVSSRGALTCECDPGYAGGGVWPGEVSYAPYFYCTACEDGSTFAPQNGEQICHKCGTCEGDGQVVHQPCNSTSDIKCRCGDGYQNSGGTYDNPICKYSVQKCTDSPTFFWNLENIDRCSLVKWCGEDMVCIIKSLFILIALVMAFMMDIVLGVVFMRSRNAQPKTVLFTCIVTVFQLLFFNIVGTQLSFRRPEVEYSAIVVTCLWIVFQAVVLIIFMFYLGKMRRASTSREAVTQAFQQSSSPRVTGGEGHEEWDLAYLYQSPALPPRNIPKTQGETLGERDDQGRLKRRQSFNGRRTSGHEEFSEFPRSSPSYSSHSRFQSGPYGSI